MLQRQYRRGGAALRCVWSARIQAVV